MYLPNSSLLGLKGSLENLQQNLGRCSESIDVVPVADARDEEDLIDFLFMPSKTNRPQDEYHCFNVVSVAASVEFLIESFFRRGNIAELSLVGFRISRKIHECYKMCDTFRNALPRSSWRQLRTLVGVFAKFETFVILDWLNIAVLEMTWTLHPWFRSSNRCNLSRSILGLTSIRSWVDFTAYLKFLRNGAIEKMKNRNYRSWPNFSLRMLSHLVADWRSCPGRRCNTCQTTIKR